MAGWGERYYTSVCIHTVCNIYTERTHYATIWYMSKNIRIQDDVYEQIADAAAADQRSVTLMTNILLAKALNAKNTTVTRGIVHTPAPKKVAEPRAVKELLDSGLIQKGIRFESKPKEDAPFVYADFMNQQKAEQSGKKACCLNAQKPCKHWVWDVNSGEGYINTLTGEMREANV